MSDIKCVMCGSVISDSAIFKVKDRLIPSKIIYEVKKCSFCNTILIDPPPKEDDLMGLYGENYNFKITGKIKNIKDIAKHIEWVLFYKRAYVRNYKIIKANIKKDQFSLLDIGCGSGMRLKVFKDLGCQVEGNEFSASCVSHLKEQLGITVYEGRAETLKAGKSYDVISMFALLEHLINPEAVIKNIKKYLNSGGLVVIQVPVTDSFLYKIFRDKSAMVKDMPRHIYIPSVRGLKIFMEKMGFKLARMYPVSFLESAAFFALTIFPSSSTPAAYARSGIVPLLKRFAGWALVLLLGIPFAVIEKIFGISSENIFIFRKIG